MGVIIIYNDPLNPKVHDFDAMCIWKAEMKNLPTPSPWAGFLKTILFRQRIIFLFNICYFGFKIFGQEKLVGFYTEKTGCIYLLNSRYLSQGLQITNHPSYNGRICYVNKKT